MNDTVVHIGMFLVGGIFSAGVAWGVFNRLQKDVNALGHKINEQDRIASKRYHNTSLVLMLVAPEAKESEITKLLTEG